MDSTFFFSGSRVLQLLCHKVEAVNDIVSVAKHK